MKRHTISRRGTARSLTLAGWTALALLSPGTARATLQQQQPQLQDRIVAIVGDTAILQTQVQEQIFRLQAQGVKVPTEPEARDSLLRAILQNQINELVIVQHARKAGITVSESDVEDAVDQRLAQIRRSFDTEQQFQQALQEAGLTLAEFRLQIAEQARAQLLTQRYLQQKLPELRPVPVSDEEIEARFEAQKASFGPKPATISLKQVVIRPQPSEDALLAAREKAEKALSSLNSGEDFAKVAREFSEDPGTRDQGGALGWVRRGQFLPAFEDALFRLKAGETSGLVESALGYHIIKVERIRGGERFARHILIRAEVTPQDVAQAKGTAEEVAKALRAGAPIDSLVRAHGDPLQQATLTDVARDRLPPEYKDALENAAPGEIAGPFKVNTNGPIGEEWAVVEVEGTSPGGDWKLADVRDALRRQIQQEKALQELVNQLRDSTYIQVRL